MKKYFLSLVAIAAILLSSACNKLDNPYVAENGEFVTFNISTPEMGTRAYSDGSTAQKLFVAVYVPGQSDYLPALSKEYTIQGQATVQLPLVTGMTYDILFWAYADGAPYTFHNDGTVTVNYTGIAANSEKLDAFYSNRLGYKVEGPKNETVYLTRPFAQLNVATKDYEIAKNAGVEITQTSIKVESVYTKFNLRSDGGIVDQNTSTDIVLSLANTPAMEGEQLEGYEDYTWLSMNYILVDHKTNVVATMKTNNTTVTRQWYNIPLQRNYRTNILGNILTTTTDFNVVIDEDFKGNMNEWDGKTLSEPKKSGNIYQVYQASELAWLAAAVNGTLPGTKADESTSVPAQTFKGETFKLMTDVDLQGKEWTPIGNGTTSFKGTFDGQGHIISNLVVNGGSNSNQGLFGFTTDGEIKNLTVHNAKVSGYLNVGVVAGTPYTSKYNNIKVTGHVEVNGMSYVGGIGGKNAYANWNTILVDVDETSYVKANSIEDGKAYRTYVGGVCGFNGEGGHSFKNITSNINVEGTTCDVGGLFGIAHYGNKFENCHSSGYVKITNASDAADAEEIGGIAGVWHNGGADVVFTDCSFTGTLSVNVSDVNLSDNTIVGASYNETGTGKLIIDGVEYSAQSIVSSNEELKKAIANGENTLYLSPSGTDYDLNGLQADGRKFVGVGEGVRMANTTKYASGKATGAIWKAITLENMTVTNTVYTMSDGGNAAFTGVTFEKGVRQAYGRGVIFTNCQFGSNHEGYALHFQSDSASEGGVITLDGCKFLGGKVHLGGMRSYTFSGCDFEDGTDFQVWSDITIENCTVDGVVQVTSDNIATLFPNLDLGKVTIK